MDSVGLFVYAITRSLIRKLLFFLNTMVYFALLTISVSACHAKWSNSETVYRNHTILDQQGCGFCGVLMCGVWVAEVLG